MLADNIKQYVNYDNYELSGLGYWPSANTWSAIALKDKITGTQANRGIVSDALGVSHGSCLLALELLTLRLYRIISIGTLTIINTSSTTMRCKRCYGLILAHGSYSSVISGGGVLQTYTLTAHTVILFCSGTQSTTGTRFLNSRWL